MVFPKKLLVFSKKHSCIFPKTLWYFPKNVLVFSEKHSCISGRLGNCSPPGPRPLQTPPICGEWFSLSAYSLVTSHHLHTEKTTTTKITFYCVPSLSTVFPFSIKFKHRSLLLFLGSCLMKDISTILFGWCAYVVEIYVIYTSLLAARRWKIWSFLYDLAMRFLSLEYHQPNSSKFFLSYWQPPQLFNFSHLTIV